MAEWATAEVRALGVLVAFLALLATLAYRWLVGHQRDFQMLLERIDKEAERRERETREITARIDREAAERQQGFDKEAEKRERAFQAALERSDRAFETLTARANELAKELAGIAQRTARSEGTLEAMTAGGPRAGSKSTSAADEPRTVAAQQVPGEPPAE